MAMDGEHNGSRRLVWRSGTAGGGCERDFQAIDYLGQSLAHVSAFHQEYPLGLIDSSWVACPGV